MLAYPIDGLNVESFTKLEFTPKEIKESMPANLAMRKLIHDSRKTVANILKRRDRRLLAIIGPCSIHDEAAAYDYARRLKTLQERIKENIFLVMRVYPEKPRSTIGWKGFVNDPYLDDTYDINEGIRRTRQVILGVLGIGVPVASEIIDPMFPPFYSELFTIVMVGARNVLSQTQRQLSSGVSGAVGLKNCLDGSLSDTLNALETTVSPSIYPSIGQDGAPGYIRTKGNPDYFIVMRGGADRTNYDTDSINDAIANLKNRNFMANIVVDCSHANSHKKFEEQQIVWHDVMSQRNAGNDNIVGLMLESNIFEGNQKSVGRAYGVSITDACIGWEETEHLIISAHQQSKAA